MEHHLLDFSTTDSLPVPPFDRGTVGVVDGSKFAQIPGRRWLINEPEILKLTPLRYANVPPPMSFTEVILSHNIVDFTISENEDDSSTTTIAVLTASSVTVYNWVFQKNKPGDVQKIDELRFSDQDWLQWDLDFPRLFFQQISYSAKKKRLWVTFSDSAGSSLVITYQVEPDIQSIDVHVESCPIKSFVRIISTSSPPNLLSLNNEVLAVHGLDKDSHNHRMLPFPKAVSRCVGIELPSSTSLVNGSLSNGISKLNELAFFGHTSGGSLYANQRLLARDCSSFLVTPAHLIFTTTQNLLKFVHLTDIESKIKSPT